MSNIAIAGTKSGYRKRFSSEPEWFYSLRKNSWEYHNDSPLPDRVSHLWRYTSPESFLIDNPSALMDVSSTIYVGEATNGMKNNTSHSALAFSKGDDSAGVMMSQELADSGVILRGLNAAVSDYGDSVEQYLGKLVGYNFGKFESLNLALWQGGFYLFVPDNTVIEKPIYLDRRPANDTAVTRLLVVLGRNSEATVIDDYASRKSGGARLLNGAVEIFAGESSRLRYVGLQRLGKNTNSFITQRVQAEKQANVYSVFGSFGGAVSKLDAGTILTGSGTESRMYGFAFGDSNQHFDHHTLHHHTAGNTNSNLDVKVVLKDNALSAYTGLIRIEETAENSEAYQENRNLLLNRGARAESIPELEILTDQVSCSHGATVGPIDPEMIFYLTSRGFSRDDAIRTVVTGFVEPTLKQVPENLQEIMRNAVTDKLEER